MTYFDSTLEAEPVAEQNLDPILPEERFVFELVGFPVTSNVATLPASLTAQGVQRLLDCNAVVATATGRKIILTPSGSTPSAGQCVLNLACSTVTFASADAVTSCNLSLLLSPAVDAGALLEADSAGIV